MAPSRSGIARTRNLCHLPDLEGSEQHGLLLLADISGYTRFVGTTGAAHSYRTVARLLELVLKRLEGILELSNIEGDALLFHADDPTRMQERGLPSFLGATFHEFERETRFIAEGADCDACAAVTQLSLKYVVHAGTYVKQKVAGHTVLFGPDVILVHRLLKNTIPSQHYVFVTESALPYLALGPTAVEHEERTDLGPARGRYLTFRGW